MKKRNMKSTIMFATITCIASALTAIVTHQKGIHDGVFWCSVIAALTTGIGILIYLFQENSE